MYVVDIDIEALQKYERDALFHARVELVRRALMDLGCPEHELAFHTYGAVVTLYMSDEGLLAT